MVKHHNGKKYVQITQSISEESDKSQTIKLSSESISDFVKILKQMGNKLEIRELFEDETTLDINDKIQRDYLKGVPLKSLTIHHSLSEAEITKMLKSRNITVLTPRQENRIKWAGKRNYRRKK